MAVSVGATRSLKTIRLTEQVRGFLSDSPVDRDGGFIRNVRILGLDSDNGRRYTPEAARGALALYEGKKVKINHPLRPNETRPVQSVFGWLEGVYIGNDGAMYAEKLHYLKSHEMAESVCEAAERNPALFSLSHNAEGQMRPGRDADGRAVVERITEVRSVDIVDDGATNKSLFEGKQMTVTLREVIESSKVSSRLKKQLLEMGSTCEAGTMGDTPLDMPLDHTAVASGGHGHIGEDDDLEAAPPDAGAAPAPDWKADLVSAIGKLVQSEDPEEHTMGLKIMKLLKPSEVEDEEEEAELPDADSAKQEGRQVKKSKNESLTEARALALCKTAGVEATADVLEAIKDASLDQALAIINLAKKTVVPEREYRSAAPRSSGPTRVPVMEGAAPKDSKGWAERLLK